MRRLLTLIAVVLTLVTGSFSAVSAQDDGTPEAGTNGNGTVFYGSDGQEEGLVSVAQVVDPFEDFDPSVSPKRGFHYVMAVVTVESTADKAIEANSYGFYLIDTDGFLSYQTYTYRSTESTVTLPDFAGGTIEAGVSLSGAIFFEVLDSTTPAIITYQPSYERLVTAADLRDKPVAPGDPVEFLAADASPAATITIGAVSLPLGDTSSSPQRGSEFAGVEVTIENIGTSALTVEPYAFSYVDAEGFVYYSYGVYRTEAAEAALPTLQSSELAAGESITGMLSFEVFAGSKPGMIFYSPSSDRQIRVAEFGDSATGVTGAEIKVTPPADVTPEATIASSPECEAVVAWGEDSVASITGWADAVGTIGAVFTGGTVNPQVARDAADAVSELADAQSKVDVPDLAADANDLVIDLLVDSAKSLNDLADALESGDTAGVTAAAAKISEIGSEEYLQPLDTAIAALTATCPALDNVG